MSFNFFTFWLVCILKVINIDPIIYYVRLHIHVVIYSDIDTIVHIPMLRTRTSRIPRMHDAEVTPYRYSRDKLRCTYCRRVAEIMFLHSAPRTWQSPARRPCRIPYARCEREKMFTRIWAVAVSVTASSLMSGSVINVKLISFLHRRSCRQSKYQFSSDLWSFPTRNTENTVKQYIILSLLSIEC